jgi:hypothetical protein
MRYLVRALATLEILSGAYNLGFFASFLTQTPIGNASHKSAISVGWVGVALNIIAIIAGVELWKGTPLGRRLSLVVQAIQLPKLFLSALFFSFSFGPEAYVLFKLNPNGQVYVTLTIQPIGQQLFYFLFESADTWAGIGVSLVSCAWIGVLAFYDPAAYAPERISSLALTRPQRFFCWAITIGGLCVLLTGLGGSSLWSLMDYGNPNFPDPLNAFMRQQQPVQVLPPWRVIAYGALAAVLGLFCLRAKRWAFWLLFLMFLPQSFEYASNKFSYSLIGPWAINFGFG